MANLDSYSQIIDGWANQVANNFAKGALAENDKQWRKMNREIHLGLKDITDNTPIGDVMRSIIHEQVKYIKSLPLEAADRVYDIHNQAIEAVVNGSRASSLYKEIMRSGDVAESRAKLIARTEMGKASGALTQARALSAGSTGYIWRTAHDSDVRHSHREMEGKFVRWDRPPTLDGLTGHAGCVPNCRCYSEVVFKDPE